MVDNFFDEKSALLADESTEGSGATALTNKELHKPTIKKLKKTKVYSAFKDNIWGTDLADMQLHI